jgi:hypothetical protein
MGGTTSARVRAMRKEKVKDGTRVPLDDEDAELEEMTDRIQEVEQSFTEDVGGYPADIRIISVPSLVIADLVDREGNEPELRVIPLTEALVMWRKAKHLMKTEKDITWFEALNEAGL